MNIQSLSIVVPTEKCVNNCAFCVSKQHHEEYGKNKIAVSNPAYSLALQEYRKRMAFARDNHCNTVMLTGDAEPTQNKAFLATFGDMNRSLEQPFRWVSIQTAGCFLDEAYLVFLRDQVGVTSVSLSISAPDDETNAVYTGHKGAPINIMELCHTIKNVGMNLRLSVNLTDAWDYMIDTPQEFFIYAKMMKADAITFRILYASGESEQAKWIANHTAADNLIDSIREYIKNNGRALEVLEFGQTRYDVDGISTVLDDDCMSTVPKSDLKYLILRPNCHLYTKWDSTASLLF